MVEIESLSSAGKNVGIGAKAAITCGVAIGDNAVIGTNAVVAGDMPENGVVCGVPAKIIRVHSYNFCVPG